MPLPQPPPFNSRTPSPFSCARLLLLVRPRRNPYLMGTLSNLFQCVGHREGVGPQLQGHWNFDFCHVEPAGMCMTDDSGRLVVDFMIR